LTVVSPRTRDETFLLCRPCSSNLGWGLITGSGCAIASEARPGWQSDGNGPRSPAPPSFLVRSSRTSLTGSLKAARLRARSRLQASRGRVRLHDGPRVIITRMLYIKDGRGLLDCDLRNNSWSCRIRSTVGPSGCLGCGSGDSSRVTCVGLPVTFALEYEGGVCEGQHMRKQQQ